MLIYITNSDRIATPTMKIKYFEPGHNYMAADSVHAESQMKRINKIYNFNDFHHVLK